MANAKRCTSLQCARWPAARRFIGPIRERRSRRFWKRTSSGSSTCLGGVFQRLRYDNLSAAVRKILRGHRREETARFVAFRSHWKFQAEFCRPGEGHEKGGVEGEAGFFRRNHLVPVPAARDLDELNAMLLAACDEELGRTIDGRQQTIGDALTIERQHLLPMPGEGFDLVEASFGHLDDKRRVKAKTNAYSAPLPPGTTVHVKLAPTTIEIWHQGHCVARPCALVRAPSGDPRPGA